MKEYLGRGHLLGLTIRKLAEVTKGMYKETVSLHNFLYILCFDCIYYETNLKDVLL
jgi:hypothetical protein